MPIKTFRGLLKDGEVHKINLHTTNGSIGYRITKFEVIPHRPGTDEIEATLSISKVSFTPTSNIDLSDQTLLGVAYWSGYYTSAYPQVNTKIIFDQDVFNQDIYVGNECRQDKTMNYYMELEQIRLDLNENTVATLQDIRNVASSAI